MKFSDIAAPPASFARGYSCLSYSRWNLGYFQLTDDIGGKSDCYDCKIWENSSWICVGNIDAFCSCSKFVFCPVGIAKTSDRKIHWSKQVQNASMWNFRFYVFLFFSFFFFVKICNYMENNIYSWEKIRACFFQEVFQILAFGTFARWTNYFILYDRERNSFYTYI